MHSRHVPVTLMPTTRCDSPDGAFLFHLLEEARREAVASLARVRLVAPTPPRPAPILARVGFSVD